MIAGVLGCVYTRACGLMRRCWAPGVEYGGAAANLRRCWLRAGWVSADDERVCKDESSGGCLLMNGAVNPEVYVL